MIDFCDTNKKLVNKSCWFDSILDEYVETFSINQANQKEFWFWWWFLIDFASACNLFQFCFQFFILFSSCFGSVHMGIIWKLFLSFSSSLHFIDRFIYVWYIVTVFEIMISQSPTMIHLDFRIITSNIIIHQWCFHLLWTFLRNRNKITKTTIVIEFKLQVEHTFRKLECGVPY